MGKRRKLGEKRKSGYLDAYVATPAYDGKVDTDFCISLAETSFAAPLYQIKLTSGVMGNGAFIDLARNIFVRMFLEDYKECTHLFFVDSDLRFEPRVFLGLVNSGLDICAGVYRRRQEPEDFPVRWTPNPDIGGLWVPDEGWLNCDRVPTGFMCISRKVIEEMAADAPKLKIYGQPPTPRLFYTRTDEDGAFIGEDFCFCDDYVERYQKPIPVWMDANFKHGGLDCNFLHFMERKVSEAENCTCGNVNGDVAWKHADDCGIHKQGDVISNAELEDSKWNS